jgi:hypothetical protein
MDFPRGFRIVLLMSFLLVSLGFLLGVHAVQAGFYQRAAQFVHGDAYLNGRYEVAGTQVHFTDSIKTEEDLLGLFNGSGIWIESGRSLYTMTKTCRHEFLHKFVQESTDYRDDEELVYALDSRVIVPECQNLMETVREENPHLVAG